MMKKLLICLAFAALVGCAPYVDRSEIDVFTHACKDDGGILTIGTYPIGVQDARCVSGRRVLWAESTESYQKSINKAQPEQ